MEQEIAQDKRRALPWRTLHYYWQELRRFSWPYLIVVATGIVGTILLNTFVPLVFARIIDKLASGNFGANIISEFLPLILAAVGSMLAGEILYRWQLWVHWKNEVRIMANLDLICFQAVANQSMSFHNNRFSGSLVSYVGRFVSAFEDLLDNLIFRILPFITIIIASTIVLLRYMPAFAII